MNKKILTGIASCALVAMTLCTGAAAQAVSPDSAAVIGTENTSFSDCVEKIRSIYNERYPEQVDVVDGVIDVVTSDKTFLECYEYEGKTAFRILEDTLMDALMPTIEPYNYDGTSAWSYYTVPEIMQVEKTYCGVASTQMALIGSGLISNTAYNRGEDKQRAIYSEMNFSIEDGAHITHHVTPYMNKYYSTSATAKYRVKGFTIYSYNKLPYYLSDSLRSNAVPIIMIPDTRFLGYYKGYSCSHYMVVKKVDTFNKKITVVDPHYDARYFGEHTISFDELYNVIFNAPDPDDRNIWASVYSIDTLGNFEYIY